MKLDLNDNRQLSLIITSFSMCIVVLILFNIHLGGIKEPEPLFEIALEEDIEEILKLLEEQPPEEQLIKTHMAYNETAKSRFEEEVEEFKTLDELLEEGKKSEETTENNPNDNNPSTTEGALPTETKKEEVLSTGKDTNEAITKSNVANKNTSIYYSLKGRLHTKLPNPIYTCAQSGKIVVNIKVDTQGNVIDASFNKASSTSANGCLIDNALTYALSSKFESSAGKPEQIGTITYLFVRD
ncbi:hypothetical protein [Leptobacterium sp. I13]|uniref:hypothetical protein n=1 Tax=Leptobacterium meishanense TaxID=3128904 RepID=UPI0030EDF00E